MTRNSMSPDFYRRKYEALLTVTTDGLDEYQRNKLYCKRLYYKQRADGKPCRRGITADEHHRRWLVKRIAAKTNHIKRLQRELLLLKRSVDALGRVA